MSVYQYLRAQLLLLTDASFNALAQNIQVPGIVEPALESAEEWLQLWTLRTVPLRSPKTMWKGRLIGQVNCISRVAEARADKDTERPSTLASVVSRILDRVDIPIRDWNFQTDLPTSSSQLGVISLDEPEPRYMSPRLGQYRDDRRGAGGSLPTNIHMVVLLIQGTSDVHV